ncbi:hypothetical protein ACIOJE_00125 [Kitasatospora sp. NPDC087861]|uniref:hypothetical protein n=1 Tax=Kitasatospora sp. NPDC087861 TaxID=3364070 RepID=UPI00381A7B7F
MTTAQGDALTALDVMLDRGELLVRQQLQRVRRRLLQPEVKTDASESVLPLPETRDMVSSPVRGLVSTPVGTASLAC